ncbi:hypothetical protein [Alienimonas chondri]|uniref:Uncharacterized protein n=1 Tax=Alienimonas chondri TaxID=2681879 RepID=A0ABX1V9L4_9PLAN|nr:hypothetical protein [Alienimonas chondri]NNJ24083.1 hypothetical protein [Alienimonas chondri]
MIATPSRTVVASLIALVAAGCGGDPEQGEPSVIEANIAEAAAAEATAEKSRPRKPIKRVLYAGPTLGVIHHRWRDELAQTEERFARWATAERGEQVDPPALPPLEPVPGQQFPALLPPPGDLLTDEQFEQDFQRFWADQVAVWTAEHPLTEDEALLLDEVGKLGLEGAEERNAAIAAAADRIRETGTDDPLVQAHLAWESTRGIAVESVTKEVAKEFADVVEALFAAEAPPWFLHRVAYWRLRVVQPAGLEDEGHALESAGDGLEAFAASLTPDSEVLAQHPLAPHFLLNAARDVAGLYPDDPEGQPVNRAADHMSVSVGGLYTLNALSSGAEAGGDPYAFHCFAGETFLETAWDARGDGMANQVVAGAWDVFGQRIAMAAQHLHAAFLHRPDLSPASTKLISVAMAGGGRLSPIAWFRWAVAAKIDHWDAYMAIANAMHPKWGGSFDILVSISAETLREDLEDTVVPNAGWEIARQIADSGDDFAAPADGPWRTLLEDQTGRFLELAATVEPGFRLHHFQSNRARALFEEMADLGMSKERTAMLRVWPDDGTDLRRFLDGYRRSWVLGPLLAADGSAAESANRLAAAFEEEADPIDSADLPALFEDVQSVLESVNGDDGDAETIREWAGEVRLLLAWRQAYDEDRSFSLPIDEDLSGFRCPAEYVTVEEGETGGIATLSGSGRNTPYLSPLVAFPRPIVIYVSISPERDESTPTRSVGIGVGRGIWPANPGELDSSDGGLWGIARDPQTDSGWLAWQPLPHQDPSARVFGTSGEAPFYPLQTMVRPDDVVCCLNHRYMVRTQRRGPSEIGRFKLGSVSYAQEPQRFRIQKIYVEGRSDFTLPSSFTEVPEPLQSEPEPDEASPDEQESTG